MANILANLQWKPILGLVLLVFATVMNWTWVFGVIFILWAVNDAIAGTTHFVEEVQRQESPVLFWTILLVWIALASYYFAERWLTVPI